MDQMPAHLVKCCRSRRICHSVQADRNRGAEFPNQPSLHNFSTQSITRVNIRVFNSIATSVTQLACVTMLHFRNCIPVSPMYMDSSNDEKNCSRVSGVSPFFSSEDIIVSPRLTTTNESVRIDGYSYTNQYEIN